ncbi:hypothetical protein Kpol_1031p8 [Vanderwaltozyma polyspora DSM 70294]|uniref:Protein BIG1 n=1 Tax=Vanderwaltozyma polyspora (strain ATCC 22028 / DSM 70294 / BCRC 21397 / CBS 2163 / NBRC 10782 / NRRL Y-8283 / UCD 57-17) TaxID=436907 RepID=A7THU2_VANPO|nr:uncharacterized protein Kpol_1031p8 [Vanderwaltozyma polyspora DSM 70294]EDO18104.1 hypothetical protein Kpol_1031p8 [Vanderwaltozyma polyspora DSM 70294]
MLLYIYLTLHLLANVFADTSVQYIEQKNVPALVFSYKLIDSVVAGSDNYDSTFEYGSETFQRLSQNIIQECSSDAYIFINQPGLRNTDFIYYQDNFKSLANYAKISSTAIKFEKVQNLQTNFYDKLAIALKDHCNIDNIININGQSADDFDAYIDSEPRIIRIEFPPLPDDRDLRAEAISTFDKNLRTIIAQIPSPVNTIFYTSLNPGTISLDDTNVPVNIFSDIFKDKNYKSGIEKNDRIRNVPSNFNEYRPKSEGMSSGYISAFTEEFYEENKELLKLIGTALIGFLIFQLFDIFSFERRNVSESKLSQSKGNGINKKSSIETKDDKTKDDKTASNENLDKSDT